MICGAGRKKQRAMMRTLLPVRLSSMVSYCAKRTRRRRRSEASLVVTGRRAEWLHHLSSSTLNIRRPYYYCRALSSSSTIHHRWQQPTPVSDCERGLFSLPELQSPEDFKVAAKKAIDESNRLRTAVAQQVSAAAEAAAAAKSESSSSSPKIDDKVALLHTLDDISKTVCNVIDAAELCRSVHVDPRWRRAADDAFTVLSEYISLLNGDVTLYRALLLLLDVANGGHRRNDLCCRRRRQLTEEEDRLAALLRQEFERDGIHLPDAQRRRVRRLQNQLTQLETTFHRNLVHCRKLFAVQDAEAVTRVIPASVLQQYGVVVCQEGNNVQLSNNDAAVLQTLLKYSTSPQLRRQVYLEHMTAVPENLPVLEELVRLRHELAVMQGFESYAARTLQDKIAGHPDAVQQFLQALLSKNQPVYKKDMERISEAKRRIEGSSVIEPWDVTFYTGILKAGEAGGTDIQAQVSQYLTLPNSLTAMQTLVYRLFGIDMKEEALSLTERWDVGSGQDESTVRRFVFADEQGRPLGTMYLDLHPRPGKYGHAAHFTVRCGCALQDAGDYQLPVVALVCNLNNTSELLTHGEVETLYHEFGHALHSLLSRTEFQHMSGTRAAMDFVETPSHWIENYAWDPEFLKILTAHHQTGEPLPDDMISRLRKSRYEFAAIERQNQILYALADQQLFGVPTGESSTEIFARLHRQLSVPYADGTHWHSRFGHLVTYGAGYYGYLYSQVFAADIWKHCFEGNSLDRKAGDLIWHKLLIHGGAKDPTVMLTDLLGRPPQVGF